MGSKAVTLSAEDLKFIWERIHKHNSKDDFINQLGRKGAPLTETLEGRGAAKASLTREEYRGEFSKHTLRGKLVLRKSGEDFSRMQVSFYHDGDNRDEEDAVGGPGGYTPGYNGIAVSVVCNDLSGEVEPESYQLQANMLEGGYAMLFNISSDPEKKEMVVRMIEEAIESAKANLSDTPVIAAPDQQRVMFG